MEGTARAGWGRGRGGVGWRVFKKKKKRERVGL